MKQQDKQLLIKDLCARLPFGVKAQDDDTITAMRHCCLFGFDGISIIDKDGWKRDVEKIRPYLRPLSSMTKEEEKKCRENLLVEIPFPNNDGRMLIPDVTTIDFFYAHHFDIHGLIEKGLAIEAPKDMYK